MPTAPYLGSTPSTRRPAAGATTQRIPMDLLANLQGRNTRRTPASEAVMATDSMNDSRPTVVRTAPARQDTSGCMSYRTQQLPFYEYNEDSVSSSPGSSNRPGSWQRCYPHPHPSSSDLAPSSHPLSRITVSTLNRWFDGRDESLRTSALLQLLSTSTADVFCLQEMTSTCLSALKADASVQRKWIITNRDGVFGVSYGSSTWYGQMTLVNKERVQVVDVRDVYLAFEGKELRPLHIVDVEMKSSSKKNRRMQIINVHLQSLEREGMERQEQIRLAALLARLAMPKVTILAGDTNFYTDKGMEVPTNFGFIDTWRTLRPGEDGHTFGFTYPVTSYSTPSNTTATSASRRIDGIFQWPNADIKPESVVIFGDECLDGNSKAFLSDHVGLTATFRQVRNDWAARE